MKIRDATIQEIQLNKETRKNYLHQYIQNIYRNIDRNNDRQEITGGLKACKAVITHIGYIKLLFSLTRESAISNKIESAKRS